MIAHLQKYLARQRSRDALRIVLGAGGTRYPGWHSTDRDTLDLLVREDFAGRWTPGTREAFLAEHVWEHLPVAVARQAAVHCQEFLRPGGWLRIAVPDALNPDPAYREYARPGGSGAGADDHQAFYSHRSLSALLESAGFQVRALEYWDEAGTFHAEDWRSEDGHVVRSRRFDPRNQNGRLGYTSLIVDGIKPQL